MKIEDKEGNIYEFSQLYIDTKKKEILGTDIKFFGNSESLKLSENNKPEYSKYFEHQKRPKFF